MKNSLTFILLLLPAFFYAQNNPNPAQLRLMAKRAAQLDGYRQLAEQVKGLRISSSSTVRDFVTESDQISTALDTVLKGARVVGTPRYSNDGVCEVDVEMDMEQLVAELTGMSNNYPTSSGRRYDFSQMRTYYNGPTVRATGSGTANGPVVSTNDNAELENLRNQYYQLLADNEQLANQLSALQAEYEQLQGNTARLASLESERQSLATQLAQVQNAYNKLVQDYRNLEARLGDLTRLQNEANQLRNQLKQAQDNLARERQMTANQLAQLQQDNALLQQDNAALATRNKQLQAELDMTRTQGQKAIQDAQLMRNQIAALQKDLDAARYQAQQAAQEANTLRTQLGQLNQLRQENAGLRQQLTSAQREMEDWKARMAQSDQMLAQVQQENQVLRQENEALLAELEELRSQIRTPPVNSDAWNNIPPQAKLMAQRAAQLDAYRNMAEMIKGLKIDSQTTVQDFVTESDTISAALDTFIKGIRIVNTSYLPDLTVEVTAEVTLEQLVEELKKIRKRYYQGGRWHEDTFNQIRTFQRTKVVQAKGSGTVR